MSHSEAWNRIVELQRRGDAVAAQAQIDAHGDSMTEAERAECIGNQFFLARRFQEAIHHYEHAMTVDQSYDVGRYHYLVGVQHERSGEFTAAFKRYQACIELESGFPDAYTELGGLLMKASDIEGALCCYEDALVRDPDTLGNYQNLVTVLELLVKKDETKYGVKFCDAKQQYSEALARLRQVTPGHLW